MPTIEHHPHLVAEVATHRPVRVTVPRKVAYDFDTFVAVQRDLFDRLGHDACVSGFDIRWELETDFRLDQDLRLVAG